MAGIVKEKRLALIHRVIVPEDAIPKEYAILVTEQRSIFIHQPKTRSGFVLRREMRYGTALITDVVPKTLEDYEQQPLESLSNDASNLSIPHAQVMSIEMKREGSTPGVLDFFVRLTMKRQGGEFQVYNFEVKYRDTTDVENMIKFYMVPLGACFKPRRQSQTRDAILAEYAEDALEIFRRVLPNKTVQPERR